jgi:hypothetical protein
LGIAQNIGNAFCFLILTQPEADNNSQPQVLAQSVIRKRYPWELLPVVERNSSATASLTFYKSDERTPLEDPIPISASDGEDVYSDVVPDSPSDFLNTSFTNPDGAPEDQEPYDDGILEVYGPPTTCPASLSDDPDTPPLQRMLLDSEEQSVLPDDSIDPDSTTSVFLALRSSNNISALPSAASSPGCSCLPAVLCPCGLMFGSHKSARIRDQAVIFTR